MKNFFSILLITLALTFNPFPGMATHMLGADFEWTCISQDTFIVKLTIYRDCNGVPLSNASIPITCATTGTAIKTLSISKPAPIDVTPGCLANCSRCQSSSCSFPYGIEKYVFIKQVVLNNSSAGSCCKINMSYTMCCRNSSITTGAANGNFYTEALLNRCLSPCDNSPSFTEAPLGIFCIGQDYYYNSGTIDIDTNSSGMPLDSISYEWCSPQAGPGSGNSIGYNGQYRYDKPIYFWGFPNANNALPRGFHLDPVTGEIGFRPMKIEQTVTALKVKEWRKINGSMQLIGELRRDMQWIVISCPNNHAPILYGPYFKQVYVGDTVIFNITTYDADAQDSVRIKWYTSIPGASWSDNNDSVKHPTGNFYWIPDSNDASYLPKTFSVTAADNACPVSSKTTRIYQIEVCPRERGDISISKGGCGAYTFDVVNTNPQGISYSWTLANQNYTSRLKSFAYTYQYPGTYPVQLKIESHCGAVYRYDTIVIKDSFLYAGLPPDTILCHPDSLLIKASIINNKGNTRFWWNTGDTSQLNIKAYINSDKLFTFTVEDSTGCQKTQSMSALLDEISLSMSNDVLKCPQIQSTLEATFKPDESNLMSYTWRLSPSPTILDTLYFIDVYKGGTYVCEVEDGLGCKVTDSVVVVNYGVPRVDAGADDTICTGNKLYKLTGTPNTPASEWTGPYLVNISGDYYVDISRASGNGVSYYYNYHVTDTNGCVTTDDKKLMLFETPQASAGGYPHLCMNAQRITLNGYPSGGTWSGTGVESNTYFNPAKAGPGNHRLTYSLNNNGCIGYDTTVIKVFDFDTAHFSAKTEHDITDYCHEYKLVKLIGIPGGGVWTGPITNGHYFDAGTLQGMQQFTYTYTDPYNCTFSRDLTVNIGEADVEINRDDNIICEEEKLSIHATTQFVNGIKWIKSPLSDGIYIGSITSKYIEYIMGVNDKINKGYWLHIKTTDPVCREVRDSVFIDINEVTADFSVDSTSGYSPLNIYFNDETYSHVAAIASWTWNFGDGKTSNLQNPQNTYVDTGYFDVSLKVISTENCMDSILKKDFIHSMHNISIAEQDESKIVVYPNPTGNEFIIKLVHKDERINAITIIDSEGKILERYREIFQSEFQIQNSQLPPGHYYLKIDGSKGHSYYAKLMKL